MAKIEVTFPKKVSGIGERDRYELEKFVFEADDNKSMSEQGDDAFIEACAAIEGIIANESANK